MVKDPVIETAREHTPNHGEEVGVRGGANAKRWIITFQSVDDGFRHVVGGRSSLAHPTGDRDRRRP